MFCCIRVNWKVLFGNPGNNSRICWPGNAIFLLRGSCGIPVQTAPGPADPENWDVWHCLQELSCRASQEKGLPDCCQNHQPLYEMLRRAQPWNWCGVWWAWKIYSAHKLITYTLGRGCSTSVEHSLLNQEVMGLNPLGAGLFLLIFSKFPSLVECLKSSSSTRFLF